MVTFYNGIVKEWPKDERKLLGQRGTVFVLGDQFSSEISVRNGNEICIGKDLAAMNSHKQYDNLRVVRRNVKFGTFIAILGKGPESIDWDTAISSNKESMATGALQTNAGIIKMKVYGEDIRDYAAVLVSAARLLIFMNDSTFKGNTFVEDRIIHAYKQYEKFVKAQIAEMDPPRKIKNVTNESLEKQAENILRYGIGGIRFRVEGTIAPELIVNFCNTDVKKWPKNHKRLLAENGLTIVFGETFPSLIVSQDNELRINKRALVSNTMILQRGDLASFNPRASLHSALLTALGAGPESINWDAALKAALRYDVQHSLQDTQRYMEFHPSKKGTYTVLLMKVDAFLKLGKTEFNKLQQEFPYINDLLSAHSEYFSFIDDKIAKMGNLRKGNGQFTTSSLQETTLASDKIALRDAEIIRLEEENLLKHLKYGQPVQVKVLKGRATGRHERTKELTADAWRETEPLTENLNRHFAPHLRLGNLLFLEEQAHTLGVLNFLCAMEAPLPNIATGIRIPLRDQFLSILSEQARNLAPEMRTPGMRDRLAELNDANHQQVQKDLLNAPLLTIAAIGTKEMVEDARVYQEFLFPRDRKQKPDDQEALQLRNQLREIANNAIRNAFIEAGKPIPDHILAIINPPEPAAPAQEKSYTAIIIPPKLSDLLQQAESFIRRTQELGGSEPPNPYNMFRARLGMEAGYPITMSLSRWVNEGGRLYADTQEQLLTTNFVSLHEALNIKQLLQTHVLNMPDIVGHRKLHSGVYTITENDPLPDALPTNRSRDNELGELMKSDGLMALKLVFSDPSTSDIKSPRTIASIQLGIEQSGNREVANERRLLVIDYLQDLRRRNQEFIDLGQTENVRRVTGQDVSLWLGQRIGFLQYLSARDNDQEIRSFAEELRKQIPAGVNSRDWLDQQIARIGDSWEKARTIELGDDFPREIRINLPYSSSDDPKLLTKLVIHDPMLSGTPVPFWSSQISIYRSDQKIGTKNLNLHMSAADESGEPGSDPNIVINRLHVAASLLEKVLSKYSETYPKADWHINRSGKLRQYTPDELQNTPNLDWTRLDTLVAATLPYTGVMTVASLIPENGLEPNDKNKIRFNLSFYRPDGSQFLEQPRNQSEPLPVIREFTMTVAPPRVEEINAAIEKFKEQKIRALKEEIRAEILRVCPEIDSKMQQQAIDLTVKRLIAETFLSPHEEAQVTKELTRAPIRKFEQNVQRSFAGLLEDAFSPYPKSRDAAAPALPALEQIISMVRFGSATRDTSISEPRTTTNPIIPYHPRTVIAYFNAAITSAKKEVGNQLGIEQLPGQQPQGHGGKTTRRTGDPVHHHLPVGDQPNSTLALLRKQQTLWR